MLTCCFPQASLWMALSWAGGCEAEYSSQLWLPGQRTCTAPHVWDVYSGSFRVSPAARAELADTDRRPAVLCLCSLTSASRGTCLRNGRYRVDRGSSFTFLDIPSLERCASRRYKVHAGELCELYTSSSNLRSDLEAVPSTCPQGMRWVRYYVFTTIMLKLLVVWNLLKLAAILQDKSQVSMVHLTDFYWSMVDVQ